MLAFEIKLHSSNSLLVVNVLWHASTTAIHGCQNTEDISSSWDCQNTAIVVGEFVLGILFTTFS